MRSRVLRVLLATSLVALASAGTAALAFGPLVRRAASQRAERFGADVTIERVRPTWSGVRLEGVSVRLADVPSASIAMATVRVEGGRFGPVTSVDVDGGSVDVRGAREELAKQLDAVLARRRPAEGTGPGPALRVHGIAASWRSPDGTEVEATGLAASRAGGALAVRVETLRARQGGAKLEGRGAAVEAHRDAGVTRLSAMRADELTFDLELPAEKPEPAPLPAPVASSSAAVPAKTAPRRPVAAAKGAKEAKPPEPRRDFRPKAAQLHKQLEKAALAFSQLAAAPFSVEVQRASTTVRRGDDTIHLGPGVFKIASSVDGVTAAFSAAAGAGDAPLSVSIDVPRSVEKDVAVELRGGPVTLSSLGVREGDLGLVDVAKGTVEAAGTVRLSPDAARVTAALRGHARALSIRSARLSNEVIHGLDVGFVVDGTAVLDGSSVHVTRAELDVGTVHTELAGDLTRDADGFVLDATYAVPLASCQGLLDALPRGLAPRLAGMQMSGTFALRGRVGFASAHPDAARIELEMANECRVTNAPPEINVSRLRAPFRRKVYAPDGQRVEVDTGPGTPGWVPYGGISRFMEAAVLTTEDGRFRSHRGFDLEAIRNSIRENLKAGRFVRGASTISMQTAKNVYLERDKTLARKLEEAVLTSYLEQELSKEQMLELYLNSIEFGPMIYGIGPAAAHYFHTSAAELSLGQALYLSSILPNPKVQHFGADGRVTPAWMGYLHRLMRGMAKRRLVAEADVETGLGEWVVFGQPRPTRVGGEGPAGDEDPLRDMPTEP